MIQHSLGQHPGAFQARVAAGSHKAEGVADQGYFDQNTYVAREIEVPQDEIQEFLEIQVQCHQVLGFEKNVPRKQII